MTMQPLPPCDCGTATDYHAPTCARRRAVRANVAPASGAPGGAPEPDPALLTPAPASPAQCTVAAESGNKPVCYHDNARETLCGNRAGMVPETADEAAVTCPECLETLATGPDAEGGNKPRLALNAKFELEPLRHAMPMVADCKMLPGEYATTDAARVTCPACLAELRRVSTTRVVLRGRPDVSLPTLQFRPACGEIGV